MISCMLTRFIWSEICEDNTTLTFLQAIRSYISIYEAPKKIYSDNSTTFKSSSKPLKEFLRNIDWPELKDKLNREFTLEWVFFNSLVHPRLESLRYGSNYSKMLSKKPLHSSTEDLKHQDIST